MPTPDHPWDRKDPWADDESEDYRRAKSDEERRQMLLLFGVDAAHRIDAQRLFAPPAPDPVPEPTPAEQIVLELRRQTDELLQQSQTMKDQVKRNHSEFEAYREAQNIQHSKDHREQWVVAIVSGIISSAIGGLIVYAVDHWSSITAFLNGLFP